MERFEKFNDKAIADRENGHLFDTYQMSVVANELQQENTILKKALELACETIKEIMPNKPMYICGSAIAERLGIPQTSEIKDYDYFIEQAKESIDEDRNKI